MATKKKSATQMLLEQVAALAAELTELKKQQQPVPAAIAKKNDKGQPRQDVYYVLLGVPSQGLPPQAIACARILAMAMDVNHIPESEAMELIATAKQSGKLRTQQEAWHIFQYYRARLIEGDFLKMLSL